MLPVFIMEDIEHIIPGVFHSPKKCVRTLLVCDGRPFVARNREPDWQCEQTRNTLFEALATLATEIYAKPDAPGTTRAFHLSIWPVCEAAGPGQTPPLRGVMLHIDRDQHYRDVSNLTQRQYLRTFAEQCAQQWSDGSGHECAAINGDDRFNKIVSLFYKEFPSIGDFFYKGFGARMRHEKCWPCDDPLWGMVERVSEVLPRARLEQATTFAMKSASSHRL